LTRFLSNKLNISFGLIDFISDLKLINVSK